MVPGWQPRPGFPMMPGYAPAQFQGYPAGMPMFPQGMVPVPGISVSGIPVVGQPKPPAEEEPDNRKGLFEMQVDAHYNMNAMLAQNILASDYFKSLYECKQFQEVIDEIWNEVDHLEPFAIGKTRLPSTSFCLLYKFFVMKLTNSQVRTLINYKKKPLIRGIGFLFLRYVCPPEKLWEWFQDYLDDPEEIAPGGDRQKKTVGNYVRELLMDIKYYGTLFRRIPVTLARDLKKKILVHDMKKEQAKKNESFRDSLEAGMKCQAQYEDGKYYEVIIDEVLQNGKFLVTWLSYGNQDEIDIGAFKPPEKQTKNSKGKRSSRSDSRKRSSSSGSRKRSRSGSRKRSSSRNRKRSGSRSKSHRSSKSSRSRGRESKRKDKSRSRSSKKSKRSGSRSRSRDKDKKKDKKDKRKGSRSRSRSKHSRSKESKPSKDRDFDAEILRMDRDAAAAHGTDYARKPVGYKKALSIPLSVGTSRKRSRSRSPIRREKPRHSRVNSSGPARPRSVSPPKKKEMSAAAKQRMANLKEIYGDASSQKQDKNAKKTRSGVDSEELLMLGFSGT